MFKVVTLTFLFYPRFSINMLSLCKTGIDAFRTVNVLDMVAPFSDR